MQAKDNETRACAETQTRNDDLNDDERRMLDEYGSCPQEPHEEASRRHNIDLGKRGEDAAARFLERRGYDIVARNWKCRAGEADIIARDEQALVFVEVKTRMDEDRGLPEEAVDASKRQRYERIAAAFLKQYDEVDIQVRFDVVGILVLTPDRALIRHHIDAFGLA